MSENNSKIDYQSPFLLKIFGITFLAGAMIICFYSFAVISQNVESAIVLTGYIVSLPAGAEKTFGYGGESPNERVDVALQGKEMSNRAFKISHQPGGALILTPLDDEIRYGGKWYKPSDNPQTIIEIYNDQSFRTRGILGEAAFRIGFDKEKNELRLHLFNPIYRALGENHNTKLFLGMNFTVLPTAEDDIYFRTSANQGKNDNFFLTPRENELYLRPDYDLATEPSENSASHSNEFIRAGETKDFGNLSLKYVRQSPTVIFLFGIKLCLGIIFIGLAFLIGPQVKTSNSLLIFGIAAFLLSLGLVLTARDFFFAPHQERLIKYLDVMFWSVIVLFGLRYPHGIEEPEQDQVEPTKSSDTLTRLILSGIMILLAYCSFHRNFNKADESLLGSFYPGVFGILQVLGGYIIVLLLSGLFYRLLRSILNQASVPPITDKIYGGIFILCCLPLIFCGAAWILNYQIMLWIPLIGRIYLPILILPLMVAAAVFSVYVTERVQPDENQSLKWWCLLILWTTVIIYRLVSDDNGGTLIISISLLSAYSLTLRNKLVPIVLVIVLIVGGSIALTGSERFDLAWRPEEAKVNYYDQAKNLRVGRDMARAGNWGGKWLSLRIPGDVRSNIHNDLVSAYLAGFFGWVILAFVLFAYLLFYLGLWGNLSPPTQFFLDDEMTGSSRNLRYFLAVFAASVMLAFLVQSLWIFIQPLQSLLPLIGLDLPGISSSGSSVLSFLVIILGTNAIYHVAGRTAKN